MGTFYSIYKHEAKDHSKLQLILYGIFFAVILITMILTVESSPFWEEKSKHIVIIIKQKSPVFIGENPGFGFGNTKHLKKNARAALAFRRASPKRKYYFLSLSL